MNTNISTTTNSIKKNVLTSALSAIVALQFVLMAISTLIA